MFVIDMARITCAGIILCWFLSGAVQAMEMPACLSPGKGTTPEAVISGNRMGDEELLARLVYAEGMSTGFGDDVLVSEAIAWGVMNRVRLGDVSPRMRRAYGRSIRGVIFKKGQFNPAVSEKSVFSRSFVCPDHPARWSMARKAAARAVRGEGNPFLQTPWEKESGLSLVVNFYYPQSSQAKGPLPPWEESKALVFIGDVKIEGRTLSADRVRFYRLTRPPGDWQDK